MTESSTDLTDEATLVYRRVHAAPRELVFQCLTQPEHLTYFWGPQGSSTPLDQIVVDLRPGGAFETTMVSDSDGQAYTMRAVYVEVVPPSRLVWTDAGPTDGMTTTIELVELPDGSTEVTTTQTNVPAWARSEEAQRGFASSLDKADAYLRELVAAAR